MDWEPLIQAATAVRENAYMPYSRYAVGAALLADDDRIYVGCNVENRTYGLTICAERVAVGTAVASGAKHVRAVVVVTDSEPPGTPCGPCRETLTEFGDAATAVLLVNTRGERVEHRLGDLLPFPFELPADDPSS